MHVEDKPSTERLLALMEGIDVGVQLRAVNTGESSGIVPQLLSRDTPVVLSRVGSFAEYDDVVTAVPVGCSAAELVEALSGELRDAPRKSTLRRAYVDAHSPARFCEALMAAIRAPANPSCAPVPLRPRGPALALAATRQETPANWDAFEAVMRAVGVNENPYVKSHIQRYRSTLMALESLEVPAVAVGLELGTSWLFPQVMRNTLGFARVDVTDFQGPDAPRTRQVEVAGGRDGPVMLSAFNVNLESDPLPAADETYDLVICCEVIEHLDVDPMFMMAEINRVTKPGGYLLLTTPNVTSSRNARKMLLGYAPHFYMQYHKDRNPYRHNIEYAPNQLREIIASSGFKIWRFWTLDNFDTPDAEIISYLGRNGWKTEERGDNMFVLGQKTSGVTDRYPPSIYV